MLKLVIKSLKDTYTYKITFLMKLCQNNTTLVALWAIGFEEDR